MAVVGYSEMGAGLAANCDGLVLDIQKKVALACEGAKEAGVETVKATIDTTESGLSPGKPDRNWTHHMNDSVDGDVQDDGTVWTVSAGWLHVQEDYFLYQEYGAQPHPDRPPIPPMHALQNAFDAMNLYLDAYLSDLSKE